MKHSVKVWNLFISPIFPPVCQWGFMAAWESNFSPKGFGRVNLTAFCVLLSFCPFWKAGLNGCRVQPFVNRLWVRSRLQEPVRRRTHRGDNWGCLPSGVCEDISKHLDPGDNNMPERGSGGAQRQRDRQRWVYFPGPPKPPNQDTTSVCVCVSERGEKQTQKASVCASLPKIKHGKSEGSPILIPHSRLCVCGGCLCVCALDNSPHPIT